MDKKMVSSAAVVLLTLCTSKGLGLIHDSAVSVDRHPVAVSTHPSVSFLHENDFDQYMEKKQRVADYERRKNIIASSSSGGGGSSSSSGNTLGVVEEKKPIIDDQLQQQQQHRSPLLPAPTNFEESQVRFGWRLVIKPTPINNIRLLVKRIDEGLNLTCKAEYVGGYHHHNNVNQTGRGGKNDLTDLFGDLGKEQTFKMAWHIPIMPQNSKNRVSFQDTHNAKHLIVDNLKESDGGEYECTATAIDLALDKVGLVPPFVDSIQIVVKPKKGSCNEPLVLCSSGECIAKRYICDGKADCKDQSDESFAVCGTYHACDGKLRCPDGRCIPLHWCCDRTLDKNCTVLFHIPCCAQLRHMPFPPETFYGPQRQQPHLNDISFLQTTIYTVIGCSMAFMFILTIMVIAICRVHLKRAAAQMAHQSHYHHPHRLGSTEGPPSTAFSDFLLNNSAPRNGLDRSGGGVMPYATTASGLLVTYNINNGVQFGGRPTTNPPPYSEQSTIHQHRSVGSGWEVPDGPPPPYCSVENLAVSTFSSDGLAQVVSYVPSGQQQQQTTNPRSTLTAATATATTTRNNNDRQLNQDVDDDAQVVLQPLLQVTGEGLPPASSADN